MKKICVISTGGTIASSVSGSVIDLMSSSKLQVLSEFEKISNVNVQFEVVSPFNILSENISKENLFKLFKTVEKELASDFDGIIITHGTDTLAYTANYLGLMVHPKIPIIIVSSNFPISDARSNGLNNFSCAVDFICKDVSSGIFVSYKNIDENVKIHYGINLMQARGIDGYVDSVSQKCFAEYVNSEFVVKNRIKKDKEVKESYELTGVLCDEIMLIKAFSSINYNMYDFSKVKPKAIVVELYHSGTIGTYGHNSFVQFCDKCTKKGIDVIITPASTENAYYKSFDELKFNSQLIICKGTSVETVLIKTMLAYGSLTGKQIPCYLLSEN